MFTKNLNQQLNVYKRRHAALKHSYERLFPDVKQWVCQYVGERYSLTVGTEMVDIEFHGGRPSTNGYFFATVSILGVTVNQYLLVITTEGIKNVWSCEFVTRRSRWATACSSSDELCWTVAGEPFYHLAAALLHLRQLKGESSVL